MKLSFSHKLQSESDVRSIQSMEDHGFSCVELFFAERESLDEQTLNMIDEVSATTNLYLTAHLPYKNLNIASIYQYVRESSTDLLTKIIDDVSDYIDIVTLHTGYAQFGSGSLDRAIENNILSLAKICDRAGQNDIMVGVENAMNDRHMVGKTFREMEAILKGVDRGNLGITFDIGHAQLTGNIEDYLSRREYILEIHAHDNFGYTDEHLPVGEGKVNWNRVYEAINAWECPLVLEQRSFEEGIKSVKYLQGLSTETGPYFRLNLLIARIREAKTAKDLLHINSDMIELSESALQMGGTGSTINHIVSSCRDAMVCRMAELVQDSMVEKAGYPKFKYALLATGSFGRGEMSVESDQDTILVLDDGIDEKGREYFRLFSETLVEQLAAGGFDRCKGNMMASNPKWRGTIGELISHLDNSYERSVIMDARYIYGDRPLSHRFMKTLHNRLHMDPYYAQELAISAVKADVGLEGDSLKIEYFGDAEDAFNIKKYGFRIFSASVKALAARHAINRTNVSDRLWKLEDLGVIDATQFKRFMFAYDQLTRVMMLGYVHNIKKGIVSNEYVQPYLLSKKDRDGLKESLRIVKELQGVVSSEFAIAKSLL
ncbi:TIM barrel protein [Methanocella sp. MCL-LM]|uniref:TIM barrel protein n=1 Tax=Methanocella sp. MCL-LM TaxID=3412035 RepID=UPI003C784FDB